jgi:hypothetical protein
MGRLMTKEDPMHVHKTLGACTLAHFGYRFFSLAAYGTMRLEGSVSDFALVACHATLSLSSLVFRLPSRRHERMPMIYPEFRAHSIIFAIRSVVCCTLAMSGVGSWACAMMCVAAMLAADAVTARLAEATTMRAMPFPSGVSAAQRRIVTFYHSLSQAHATALMLLGADEAFAPLLAIQLAAFLMTLVRKGFITTKTWQATYTVSLAVCIFVVDARDYAWIAAINVLFPLGRMWLGAPKYAVWAILFAVRFLSEHVAPPATVTWLEALVDGHLLVLRLGYVLGVACVILYGLH